MLIPWKKEKWKKTHKMWKVWGILKKPLRTLSSEMRKKVSMVLLEQCVLKLHQNVSNFFILYIFFLQNSDCLRIIKLILFSYLKNKLKLYFSKLSVANGIMTIINMSIPLEYTKMNSFLLLKKISKKCSKKKIK